MIAKMKHTAVRTIRSPSIVITTLALVALTAGAADMLTDAQNWLASPSTNFGWFLTANLPESAPSVPKRFGSRQGPSILGPSLLVELNTSAQGGRSVPEPSGGLLLSPGLVGLARWRRRKAGWVTREKVT